VTAPFYGDIDFSGYYKGLSVFCQCLFGEKTDGRNFNHKVEEVEEGGGREEKRT
jgi:hypothetical protein